MRRLVDVREGEARPLSWAMAFALLAVATAIVSRALSDALFLTTFPLAEVPRFYIVSNVFLIAVAMAYSALVRVLRPVPLNVGLLLLVTATFGVAGLLVEHPDDTVLFGLCVWLTVAAPLINIVCWNTIVDRFHSRQGRRLFPIVFAASTTGAIVAGLGLGPFIGAFGVESLFGALAVLTWLTVPITWVLQPRGRVPTETSHRSFIVEGGNRLWRIFQEGVSTVARNRLLRSIAAVVFLAALVTNLVDFAFKGMLQANYTRDEIGVFYGYFNAIANTANLVLQLFVVAWAMERWGVSRIFRVLPASLLLGTVALGWMPGFVTIVGLKFLDGLLRFTFQGAANEVAIAPIPYVERNRAKIFIKGAMNPLGAITAGLLLLPFAATRLLPETYLAAILLLVLGLWLAVARHISRTYTQQLYASLRRRQARHTPHPGEDLLFGAGLDAPRVRANNASAHAGETALARPNRQEILASHVRWSSLAEQTDDGDLEEVEPTLTEPGLDPEIHPVAGLSDASPVVRTETLEQLAARVRRGLELPVTRDLLDGLLWRELQVAFALLSHRLKLGDLAGARARRALTLLNARLDSGVYRVFLIVGLMGDVHTAKAAYFGFRAEGGRTRAHAVDLMDALLDGLPQQRIVLLLLEEMGLESRLERAARLGALPAEVFDEPQTVLAAEHDPQLRRLLERLTESTDHGE